MGLENGEYFIFVKQPELAYFSLPPLTYFPKQGEIDAQVPDEYTASASGVYGLVCRYQQDLHKYYLAYIDPFKNRYAILRFQGGKGSPLTNPTWQPISGLREATQMNRIGLSCQDNQVTVTVNGSQAAQVSDPEMAQFGDGKLGMAVITYSGADPQGLKVLFDNAKFWPPD